MKCFFCGQEFKMSPGSLLSQDTCAPCFTMNPSEIQWQIYRTYRKIQKHKWKLGEPERKRKAAEARAERQAERLLTLQEMTPQEIEEFHGEQGAVLNSLRKELGELPVILANQ